MQWETQDLHTQLFSPNGAAQEVPVSAQLFKHLRFSCFGLLCCCSVDCVHPPYSGHAHELITE